MHLNIWKNGYQIFNNKTMIINNLMKKWVKKTINRMINTMNNNKS